MASRIRREDTQEETNGAKNPPRRNQQEKTQPRVVTDGIVFETSVDLHQ